MNAGTAHIDSFARDNLPPESEWPTFLLDRPEFRYPARLNCAAELLDARVAAGEGDRLCFIGPNGQRWSYADLQDKANRIAAVLTEDLGLVPGNRVMIRGANNPMFMACWFGIAKAGGIVVATMPLLRGQELAVIAEKAEIALALCDERLKEEMDAAQAQAPCLKRTVCYNGSGEKGAHAELEDRMASKSGAFETCDTAADDCVLIAFTSGTTGKPKGTMHFHRDVMAICDAFPRSVLKARPDDIFIGSPPLAFTFGLGGLATFPMRVGAASILLERLPPEELARAIERHRATVCFTAPTAYRAMLNAIERYPLKSLRKCVSAGETLPKPTFVAWREATGIRIIDGIGATEMLHIFISAVEEEIKPGATGKPIPGYEARIVDDEMNEMPVGEVGRLAVRGPTGCRYLADPRQRDYVRDGWNLTGDAYLMDAEGYFHFQARADDMIVSAGYNISGPEVEAALMSHPAVAECAVVGAPDADRGTIVKAFVMLAADHPGDAAMAKTLQDHVKKVIAPYKYPRAVEFVTALPKTETGKVQRFRLRRMEEERKG
ncbi:benzoate-CoA ligase family protein [Marivibrio halodurans]|uniref:Benzoate-CoA ligase family protein n=1 Tax=Marivibrio halodurans TaxID=2039722 RepID=A0A8J7S222_9PROT|nr:benzoate-CoA ligase family protein [Marivibrio halodurans]MBP5857234.1 benzoate-CoA ligase family protein [Marivibrio halodurans]